MKRYLLSLLIGLTCAGWAMAGNDEPLDPGHPLNPGNYLVTVTADEAAGTVTGTGLYPHGSTVTLEAIPNEGYEFVGWSDEVTDNPRTLTLMRDVTLSTTWRHLTYTVTFVDEDGATVLGEQTVAHGEAAIAPEIETPKCYTLTWDKEFSNITTDLTVTAIWTENVIASGTCNSNCYNDVDIWGAAPRASGNHAPRKSSGALTWKLTCDSVLVISGEGTMTNYRYYYQDPTLYDNHSFGPGWGMDPGFGGYCTCPWQSYRNLIKSVQVAEGVTSIGDGAFENCTNITSVSLPSTLTEIGDGAFEDCGKLAEIVIPSSVRSLGDDAFRRCSALTSINIPSSVITIGRGAFGECTALTSATIPSSVTSIGEAVFFDCYNLTSLTVESDNSVYDSRNNCKAIIHTASNTLIAGCSNTIIPSDITVIADWAFSGSQNLTSATLPSGLTSIGQGAFNGCIALRSLTIPAGVSFIGEGAFNACYALTSVNIPDGITNIYYYTFDNCRSLDHLAIPASVTSIQYAFSGCASMTYVEFLSTTPPSMSSVFYQPAYDFYVPCGTQEAYTTALNVAADKVKERFLNISYSITSANKAQGTVAITSEEVYCDRKELVVAATPAADYIFLRWSDGNTDNPRSLTVTRDTIITAQWTQCVAEHVEEEVVICYDSLYVWEPWEGHTHLLTEARTYHDTLHSKVYPMCDSIVYTLSVSMTPKEVDHMEDTTIAVRDTLEWRGHTIVATELGQVVVYTDTVYDSTYGCVTDIYFLYLTSECPDVIEAEPEEVVVCYDSSYVWEPWEGRTLLLTEARTYHDTLRSKVYPMCDSIRYTLTLNTSTAPTLTVEPIEPQLFPAATFTVTYTTDGAKIIYSVDDKIDATEIAASDTLVIATDGWEAGEYTLRMKPVAEQGCQGEEVQATITINRSIEIDGDIDASDLVTDAGTQIIIKPGGRLTLLKDLIIHSLILRYGEEAHAQIAGIEHLIADEVEIIIDLPIPAGQLSKHWFAFAVPFEVSVAAGIRFDGADAPSRFGYDFVLDEFDGHQRATTQEGWKRVGKTDALLPGHMYMIATAEHTTWRFRAARPGELSEPEQMAFSAHRSDIGEHHAGWNGIANTLFTNAAAGDNDIRFIITYDNLLGVYVTRLIEDYIFKAAAPFFVQVAGDGAFDFNDWHYSAAPARKAGQEATAISKLTLANAADTYADKAYVSFDPDKVDAYLINHDLEKMQATAPSVPQLWLEAYGMHLSAHELPLGNEPRTLPLGLYAPADGDYTIAMTDVPADISVWLTLNGQPVWNIAEQPYTVALNAGDNSNYALYVQRIKQVPTDITTPGTEATVQKVMIGDKLFILRDGKIFNVTGVRLR